MDCDAESTEMENEDDKNDFNKKKIVCRLD